jgi:hypothetical protein
MSFFTDDLRCARPMVAAHPDTLRLQPLVAETLTEGASQPSKN